MSFSSSGGPDPRNKFSGWYLSLSGSAILGAVSAIGGALAIFSSVTLLTDLSSVRNSNAPIVLGAMLGLLAFGVANLWFTVSLMGFGFRIAQFAKAHGTKLKLGPGWAIGGWFIPFASLFLPYFALKQVAGLGSQEAAARQRSVLSFWIWWVLLSNLTSAGLQWVISNNVSQQLNGWKLFAASLTFFIVPFMMGRKVFGQINEDLKGLIV